MRKARSQEPCYIDKLQKKFDYSSLEDQNRVGDANKKRRLYFSEKKSNIFAQLKKLLTITSKLLNNNNLFQKWGSTD